MRLAYFDSNVWTDIRAKRKEWIGDELKSRFKKIIVDQTLGIIPGLLNIDEILANPCESDALADLRLLGEVCDWNRIAKPPEQILLDDVRHFAFNGDPAHPFLRGTQADRMRGLIKRLLSNNIELAELRAEISEGQPRKKKFRTSMQVLKQQMKAESDTSVDARISTFDEFFARAAGDAARVLAEELGFDKVCGQRSWDDFLRVRSVRMAVSLSLSHQYVNLTEKSVLKSSDGDDIRHAVVAAATADFLVTHDDAFLKLIRRVLIKNFSALRLDELLDPKSNR